MSLKSELQNGAVVEMRNGYKAIYFDELLLYVYPTEVMWTGDHIKQYHDDLLAKNCDSFDIMKINNNTQLRECPYGAIHEVLYRNEDKWTWVRNETILTEEEVEYLKNFVEPFRNDVCFICKMSYKGETEHIVIGYNSVFGYDSVSLPIFYKNDKYKRMVANKHYTVESLGL